MCAVIQACNVHASMALDVQLCTSCSNDSGRGPAQPGTASCMRMHPGPADAPGCVLLVYVAEAELAVKPAVLPWS